MNDILTTDKLCRKFGDTYAVRMVDLHVKKGDIYGLIGRNGAGKTTILKMVSGQIRPTQGTYRLFDTPSDEAERGGVFRRVGALIENPGLHPSLSGFDNLKLKCLCAGIPFDDAYIMGLLETVGLRDAARQKAGNYSLGMKQRLGIALTLVGGPELLVLDEPINGLDPQGIADVREILTRLHAERGITILISSHILEELSKIVTTCGILEKGFLLREFSREEMEHECRDRVVIRSDTPEAVVAVFASIGLTQYRIQSPDTVEVYERVDDTPSLIAALAGAGVPLREVYIGGQSLEDFFFGIVGGVRNA